MANRILLLGIAVLIVMASLTTPVAAAEPAVRVLVWDERQPTQKQAYDPWLGDTIAAYLRNQPGFEVKSVALADPDQGLSDANLDGVDVIVWWGHVKHRDILPATAKKIVDRIQAGKLSLVALHSAHWATPFVQAMNARATDDAMKLLSDAEKKSAKITFVTPLPGKPPAKNTPMTPSAEKKVDPATGQVELIIRLPICCFPFWRNDGKPSHVTTLLPDHPIAKGVPATFDIPHTEMYDEPFHVPAPDAVVFEEKWDAGERFRSGMVWNVGKGKVFYFRPGHETHAVYKEAAPLKIVENACRWMAQQQRPRAQAPAIPTQLQLVSAAPASKPLAKYEPPDGVTWHGVCLPGSWADADLKKNLDAYRNTVTKQPLVLHSIFLHAQEHGKWRTWHWIDPTPDGGKCAGEGRTYVELARKNGMVPVIAWGWINYFDEENSPKLQDVPTGKYDWYLDDWIKGVKEYKDPIFIRLSHEMDGDWYPYSEGYKKNPTRNTAADYVAYWKHVVDRFRKAGVTNVAWVWCVNGDRSGGKDWPDYYPGDDYVDWLAIDLYSSRNPKPVVDDFLKLYGKTGKPIMIPEGGTGPEQTKWNTQFPGDAAWVKAFFDVIEATPQIKAVCWFQWDKQWNVERDAGQLAEYQKRIAGKRYQAGFEAARPK